MTQEEEKTQKSNEKVEAAVGFGPADGSSNLPRATNRSLS